MAGAVLGWEMGAGTLGKSRQGFSPYQGEMEQPGSLAAGEELQGLALEKGDGPPP